MTGFLASLSARARSSIAAGWADGGTASTAGGASALIASIRNSVGTETKTGPFGAAIASWQARCPVCGRITLALRPELHFRQDAMRRAGRGKNPLDPHRAQHAQEGFGSAQALHWPMPSSGISFA